MVAAFSVISESGFSHTKNRLIDCSQEYVLQLLDVHEQCQEKGSLIATSLQFPTPSPNKEPEPNRPSANASL